jgi:uncharacterized protein YbjT (DUF2867 family)
MSQASARRAAQSHAARNHWIAESVFDWSGVPVTHLCRLCLLGILYFAKAIKVGELPLPMDIARAIASILVAPEAHKGQEYLLYGAKELSFPQMADEMTQIFGKPVKFKPTDVATLRTMLGAADGKSAEDFFWQHIQAITIDHNNAVFAGNNDLVETIGGRKPMTFGEFVYKHRGALTT